MRIMKIWFGAKPQPPGDEIAEFMEDDLAEIATPVM